MRAATHRYFLRMLIMTIMVIMVSSVLYMFRNKSIDIHQYTVQLQQQFISKDKQLSIALSNFVSLAQDTGQTSRIEHELIDLLISRYEKKGLSFFLFQQDSLTLWTSSHIPTTSDVSDEKDFGVVRMKNGWFAYRQDGTADGKRFLVMSVIKYDYRYQNSFLVNRFHDDYDVPAEFYFITDRPEEGYPIVNQDNEYAFSINLRRSSGLYENRPFVIGLAALLAISGLLLFVFFAFRYFSILFYKLHRTLAIAGFIASMLLVRMLTFVAKFPRVIYDDTLFSPALYATSGMLPSLGDLFFNVLFFSIIAFFLFTHLKHFSFKRPLPKRLSYLISVGILASIYLFCNLAVFLIRSLVIDSHLNLDVNFIFSLDLFSLTGFLIIGCIFFAFFFLSVVLFRLSINLLRKRSRMWFVYLLSLLLFVLPHLYFLGPYPLQWLLYVTAIIVFEIERKSDTPQTAFAAMLASLFLFSIISSFALYHFNLEKDFEKKKTMALQLASEQDPVAEFLFLEMEEALFNDHQLRNLVRNDPYNEGAIYRYLQHHYFYDFWVKYDLQVTVCRTDEMLLIKPSNLLVECQTYFSDYMATFGKPTISNELIYLDNNTGRNSYITVIPVSMRDADHYPVEYHLYLEIDAKFIGRDLGFPELLIDEQIDVNRELVNYSYANYKDGVLINKSGMYNYSNYAFSYNEFEGEFASFIFDNYRHLLFRKDDNTLIIISRSVETFFERIAPFSYLFILFFVLIVIFYMLTSRKSLRDIMRFNFKKRVQFSMITIVIVSVLAIGGASALFILDVSSNKNLAFLREKAQSILIETEMTLDMDDIVIFDESTIPYLSDLLLRQSNVFFTDINLFDVKGELITSSRPRVFEEGLAGAMMDPVAFFAIRNDQLNQFVHTERIGRLEYLSAYVLLRNHYQELLGYLNLPYFSKQGELRSEMSYFLVAFINIYLLLLVVAIVVALFISNFVTQPLQLIRESFSRVQLGRTNQKIDWNRKDEIGSLVGEYNRMIDELAQSAELLARSERETAWREMAKQVAHEIKNPLTPMRLNIQYLEKAWQENVPDWDQRLARFSRTMVEQIDNLALIAGAFSDFAQMPEGNNRRLDVRTLLPDILNLYHDNERISFRINLPDQEQHLEVRADRNHMMRVMNNLINNAIQAYPKHEPVHIDINCKIDGDELFVEVKDYGSGIPDSLKTNIFSPNFTTKTSGMGLGLSIVKTIIENLGGKVGFFSKEGHGSAFHFRLPIAPKQ